ncbi:MAG: holo-ACP synthase [Mycobacteriales bacterium]
MAVVGVGVDVVDVTRLTRVLTRTPRLRGRVFAADELAYAGAGEVALRRLAARFAAKEAVSKALGARGVRWRDIEVVAVAGERPVVKVSGHTADLAAQAGVVHWHLSLSHDGAIATAVVIAES